MSDNISFSGNRSSIQKYKIVLVGDQNVGKSSIIARYIRNEFDPTKNVKVVWSSPPLALILSVKTLPPAARSSAFNYGTQPGSNASKASSPATSRTRTWLLWSSISPVYSFLPRSSLCLEHPQVGRFHTRGRQEGYQGVYNRQQMRPLKLNFLGDQKNRTGNRREASGVLPRGFG